MHACVCVKPVLLHKSTFQKENIINQVVNNLLKNIQSFKKIKRYFQEYKYLSFDWLNARTSKTIIPQSKSSFLSPPTPISFVVKAPGERKGFTLSQLCMALLCLFPDNTKVNYVMCFILKLLQLEAYKSIETWFCGIVYLLAIIHFLHSQHHHFYVFRHI